MPLLGRNSISDPASQPLGLKAVRVVDIILDITDISNQKVRFSVEHHDSNTSTSGDSTQDSTYFRFIRL